jgi:four helix bundle protein
MRMAEALKERTRRFALDTIRLVRRFPRTLDGEIVGRQLVRASTSTAANYRAACRSRSPAEFASKIGTVTEEADESQFWLDIVIAATILDDEDTRRLLAEATELTAIFTASRATAKSNLATKPR